MKDKGQTIGVMATVGIGIGLLIILLLADNFQCESNNSPPPTPNYTPPEVPNINKKPNNLTYINGISFTKEEVNQYSKRYEEYDKQKGYQRQVNITLQQNDIKFGGVSLTTLVEKRAKSIGVWEHVTLETVGGEWGGKYLLYRVGFTGSMGFPEDYLTVKCSFEGRRIILKESYRKITDTRDRVITDKTYIPVGEKFINQ